MQHWDSHTKEVRIMRVITALEYAAEVTEKVYAPTPLAKAMTNPAIEACMIHR